MNRIVETDLPLCWFRRLALLGTVMAATVVVLGAWVRLTDAGLGCPDWPGCYGHLYPQGVLHAGKAWHEMIHRYVAAFLGLIIVVLLGWALARRKYPDQPLVPVALLFGVVCLQGALGALTVTLLLKPLIVTAHLLGGLTTLGLLWWLAIVPETVGLSAQEAKIPKFAGAASVVLVMQLFLGGWTSTNYAAIACPDFPVCQRSWWPPMDFRDAFVLWRGLGNDDEGGMLTNPARTAIHVAHRIGAAMTGFCLFSVGLLAARRSTNQRRRRAGLWLMAAVAVQIGVGIATVHFAAPLPLATLHNAGAAALVLTMVWLLRAHWPLPRASVLPFIHVDRSR